MAGTVGELGHVSGTLGKLEVCLGVGSIRKVPTVPHNVSVFTESDWFVYIDT